MLHRHRSALAELMLAHEQSGDGIREKYAWLATYHNSFCSRFFAEWPDVALPDMAADSQFVPYLPSA